MSPSLQAGRRRQRDRARAIKAAIHAETGLTASAGVSFNKFLAKTRLRPEKPDGLTVIRPEQALAFLAALPIERFHGVGPATAPAHAGARTSPAGPICRRGASTSCQRAFGRVGRHYRRMAHALDDRPVEPDRPRRSLSVETTFEHDLPGTVRVGRSPAAVGAGAGGPAGRSDFIGRTLTLKVRYGDFRWRRAASRRPCPFATGSRSCGHRSSCSAQRPRPDEPIRLLGLGFQRNRTDDDTASWRCRSWKCTALSADLDRLGLLLLALTANRNSASPSTTA